MTRIPPERPDRPRQRWTAAEASSFFTQAELALAGKAEAAAPGEAVAVAAAALIAAVTEPAAVELGFPAGAAEG